MQSSTFTNLLLSSLSFFAGRALPLVVLATVTVPRAIAQDATARGGAIPSTASTAPLSWHEGFRAAPAKQTSLQMQQDQPNTSPEGKQTGRVLEIVPNFRPVFVDEKLPPQPIRNQFIKTSENR